MRRWSDLSPRAQDTAVVLAQFLFCGALYATNIYRFVPDRIDAPLIARFGVLVLLCVCSYWRRRAPVAALTAAMVPFCLDLALGATLPVWLIVSDLVYAVALYGSDRQSVGVVRVSALVSILTSGVVFVVTEDGGDVIVTLGAAAAFLGTPLWWARSVRQHKIIARAERDRAESLGVIAQLDRRAAVEAERSRMARDLHDVVAGHISAIAIQSEAVLRLVDSPTTRSGTVSGPSIRDIVMSIRTNSTDALGEMRSMIGLLRSDETLGESLVSPGRIDEVPRLVASARASGTAVTVHRDFDPESLPAAVDHAAYRIVQESLTNAIVHAPRARTTVELRGDDKKLTIVVTNDVTTAAASSLAAKHAGTGVENMRQRAELLGGSLHAGPHGTHWVVTSLLPLNRSAT